MSKLHSSRRLTTTQILNCCEPFDVSAIFSPSEDSVLLISGEDDDVDELIDALEAGDELDND